MLTRFGSMLAGVAAALVWQRLLFCCRNPGGRLGRPMLCQTSLLALFLAFAIGFAADRLP